MNTEKKARPAKRILSTREYLNRARKVSALMGVASLFPFAAGLEHGQLLTKMGDTGYVQVPVTLKGVPHLVCGVVVIICAVLVQRFAVRCRTCRRCLGRVLSPGAGPFAISRSMRFCPYCSAGIDELPSEAEVSDTESSEAAAEAKEHG